MTTTGVSEYMFFSGTDHPGQNPESHKTVVCVCVCVEKIIQQIQLSVGSLYKSCLYPAPLTH